MKDGLGDKAKSMIVVEAPYETTDPTVDSQIISMKSAGADVFVNTGIPKFAAQAIRKAAEIGWKPLHILSSVGNSVGATLKPAGLENAKDIVSDFYIKDPTDPQWKNDPGYQQWVAFMDKYYPEGDKTDAGNVVGPCFCQTLVQVLKQCGDNLTRENIMKEAANLHDFTVPMLLPGIKINTSPTDFAPDQADPDGAFRRRAVEAVRPGAQRRDQRLRPAASQRGIGFRSGGPRHADDAAVGCSAGNNDRRWPAVACYGSAGWCGLRRRPPADTRAAPTDAIVVLTGGSLRLQSGIELLREGKGRKLFISGVNQQVDLDDLLRIFGYRPGLGVAAASCSGTRPTILSAMRRRRHSGSAAKGFAACVW